MQNITMWEAYKEQLRPAICDYCNKEDSLYALDGDIICKKCLQENEAPEPEENYNELCKQRH